LGLAHPRTETVDAATRPRNRSVGFVNSYSSGAFVFVFGKGRPFRLASPSGPTTARLDPYLKSLRAFFFLFIWSGIPESKSSEMGTCKAFRFLLELLLLNNPHSAVEESRLKVQGPRPLLSSVLVLPLRGILWASSCSPSLLVEYGMPHLRYLSSWPFLKPNHCRN